MTQQENNNVTISDIKVPFWSLVSFMIKAVIASIPAFIILSVLFAIGAFVVKLIFGGFAPF